MRPPKAAGSLSHSPLPDGSRLTLTLTVSTNKTSPALAAHAVPSWSGSAIGHSGFNNIPGNPVLYETVTGSTVHIALTNIVVTPPAGSGATVSYAMIGADGESSNQGESLTFATNGQPWVQVAQIPNGTAYPTVSGLGTTTVVETGVKGTVGSFAFASFNNPTQISSVAVGSGLQGPMFAIRYASLTVNAQLNGARANAADQFSYRINTAGGQTLASGITMGAGPGPFTPAVLPTVAAGYPLAVTETLAPGSTSGLGSYATSLTCTNLASAASSTVMPVGKSVTSFTFPTLQYGDAVSCLFTNTANRANAGITKTGPATVSAGSTLSYSLAASNAGPADASGLLIKDPAVANFTATSVACVAATGGAQCPAAGTLSVANLQGAGIPVPTLPSGSSVTLSVTGTAGNGSGNISNTASAIVPATVVNTNPAPTSTAATTVTPAADAATALKFPNGVDAGKAVTGTVVFSNMGLAAAGGDGFSITLPPNLAGVPVLTGLPAGATYLYHPASGAVTLAGMPTTVPPGSALAPITVNYVQPASATSTVTAAFTTTTTDSNPANNAASVTVGGTMDSDLSVTLTLSAHVNAGQAVSGSAVFKNNGPSTAHEVTYSLILPAHLTMAPVISGLPAGAGDSYAPDTGVVTLTGLPATLMSGSSVGPVSFTYPQPPSGTSTVAVAVTSSTLDLNAANNKASATSTGAAAQLMGTVYADNNQDARYDAGDTPIAGAAVQLLIGNHIVATTLTTGAGTYTFTSEPVGAYTVAVAPLPGNVADTPSPVPVNLGSAGTPVVNFGEIPAGAVGVLVLTKTTPLVDISVGQSVPYTITAANPRNTPVYDSTVTDLMPAGFRFRTGSGRVNGQRLDPAVSGRQLTWTHLHFAPGETKTFSLVLTAGAGISSGEFVNQAMAYNALTQGLISNVASATVRITADPTFDCPDLIGKVFDDANANGVQDPGEKGIPGVRLVTAQGLLVTTDAEGRYHIVCPVLPDAALGSNFIVKLDERTLPSGYRLTTDNPDTVRLTAGKLSKLNFGATIHHVVRIELSDAAFDGDALRADTARRIDALVATLNDHACILRLAYTAVHESDADVGARLRALQAAVAADWKAHDIRFPPAHGRRNSPSCARGRRRGHTVIGRTQSALARAACPALLSLSAAVSWAAGAGPMPPNTERAEPDRPPSDTVIGRLITAHAATPKTPPAVTLQLLDTTHQTNFDSGSDALTDAARAQLDTFVASLRTLRARHVLVSAHTDSVRLVRDAKRRFGTNQRLSEARAARVVEYLSGAVPLPQSAFAIQGFGAARPVAGNDNAAGRAQNRRAEVAVWVEREVPPPTPPPVPETRLQTVSNCIGNAADQLPAVRITVDGVPLDSREALNEDDRQRCVDVALARAEIQIRFDPLEQQPFLNTIATPQLGVVGKSVSFRTYTNYPRYIDHAEIRLFAADQSTQQQPLAVLRVDAGHSVDWTPPPWKDSLLRVTSPVEETHSVTYVLRVYGRDGRFDETKPRRLDLVRTAPVETPALADAARDAERAAYGENTLRLHNIPTAGGAITVNGSHVPPGDRVLVQGLSVPVDDAHNFVARQIMPPGPQQVSVEVLNDRGEGLEFTRNITVASDDAFFVGLADLTAGARSTSGPIDLVTGDPNLARRDFVNGQLAFYYKGLVKGDWLLTAAADTQEQPIRDLFSNFARKDPEDVLRRIDPNRYYPVYGDDSTTVQDAPTSGKFYVRLEKGESSVLWGNFQTQMTGTDFIQYARTLYGLDIRYRSPETTSLGEKKRTVDAFWADPGTLESRQEFRGTGGSLYYLRNQDISVGSEQVWIEVRDKDSGIVQSVTQLVPAQDYDINYLQGRILLHSPLSATANGATLVHSAGLDGDPVYLVTTYEYVPDFSSVSSLALGGHASEWFGDHVQLGISSFHQGDPGEEQDLRGVNGTYRYKPGTYVKFEYAHSDGPGTPTMTSETGGLSFDTLTTSGGPASAERIEAAVDLAEITDGMKGKANIYSQERDANFSGPGQLTPGVGVHQDGGAVSVPVSASTQVVGKFDSTNSSLETLRSGEFGVEHKIDDHWRVAVGTRIEDRENVVPNASAILSQNGERTDVAVTVGYQPSPGPVPSSISAAPATARPNWDIYGFVQDTAQRTETRPENDRTGLGGSYQISSAARLGAEVSDGSLGFGGKVSTDYRIDDHSNVYVNYTLAADQPDALYTGREGTLTGGTRYRFNDSTSVYGEERMQTSTGSDTLTRAYGVDFSPSKQWTYGLKFERGTVSDPFQGDISLSAVSGTLQYTRGQIKYGGALEWRRDDSSITGASHTELTRNSLSYQRRSGLEAVRQTQLVEDQRSGRPGARRLVPGSGHRRRVAPGQERPVERLVQIHGARRSTLRRAVEHDRQHHRLCAAQPGDRYRCDLPALEMAGARRQVRDPLRRAQTHAGRGRLVLEPRAAMDPAHGRAVPAPMGCDGRAAPTVDPRDRRPSDGIFAGRVSSRGRSRENRRRLQLHQLLGRAHRCELPQPRLLREHDRKVLTQGSGPQAGHGAARCTSDYRPLMIRERYSGCSNRN